MKYFLGIDMGTPSCKVLLMNFDSIVVDTESIAYTFNQPQTGWSEQDPNLWVDGTLQSIKAILSRQGNG